MRVSELIDILYKCDRDAEVSICIDERDMLNTEGINDVIEVVTRTGDSDSRVIITTM